MCLKDLHGSLRMLTVLVLLLTPCALLSSVIDQDPSDWMMLLQKRAEYVNNAIERRENAFEDEAMQQSYTSTATTALDAFLSSTRRRRRGHENLEEIAPLMPSAELPGDFTVYVHDLPTQFNSDLLDCYKKLTGMSIWMDDAKERAQNTADVWIHQMLRRHPQRTLDAKKANAFFVPFYGFLSTNFSGTKGFPSCGGLGHTDRVDAMGDWLKAQPVFAKYPEKHLFTASYWGVAHKDPPRWKNELLSVVTGKLYDMLQQSHLLVYEPHFGSFRVETEYKSWHSIITTIPYVATRSLTEVAVSASLDRPIPLYFRGNLRLDGSKHNVSDGQLLRRGVYQCMRKLEGAHVEDSSDDFQVGAYAEGMRNSTFCLVPRGDTPTSRRLFDAIAAGCIPVIAADDLVLPFEDFIDWRAFSVRVREEDVRSRDDALVEAIASLSKSKIKEMQRTLVKVRDDFIYGIGDPTSISNVHAGRAVDNILIAVARRQAATVRLQYLARFAPSSQVAVTVARDDQPAATSLSRSSVSTGEYIDASGPIG